ncbi:MAG: ATP-dependent helicase [Candidatus Magasanikbacteria bacterium]|nr:ATP-dependent helicase [Candidatus Magasanikbacteria bacterium]
MIDFKKELNKEQLEVAENGDGYCLVLAGAGSGKTRTITYRVAYLLEKGVKPENILLLTFTNKAAKEMIERVEKLTGAKKEKNVLWRGTFHAVANRLLRHLAALVGYQINYSVLDEDDSETLLKSCVKDLHLDGSRRFPSVSVIKSLYSFSRNSLTPLDEVLEIKAPHFLGAAENVKEVCALYQKKKKETNAMDFDDLLCFWLEILGNPDILNKIAGQFHFILIDEYQDTNRLQAAIVKKIASRHHNLLVVGDDAQSIYSFRAADINNILEFPKEFKGVRIFHLTTNYRSTPNILDLANEVIAQNKKQFSKNLKSRMPVAQAPQLIMAGTPYAEAGFIVKKIFAMREAGRKLNNMAVLFRAAFHAQILEMELAKNGIPYEMRGGLRFFERAHVKDAISLLRVINNLKDELAWFRVLEIFQGIGQETAKVIINEAKRSAGLKGLLTGGIKQKLSGRAERGWEDFVSLAKELEAKQKSSPGELVEIIADSVYADYLKEKFENADDRLDDIRQLAFYAKNHKSLNNFLSEIALDESLGRKKDKDGKERLILSTIHQAKGLEWETVFLINLADGAFPNERALKEAGGEEEERRLFYVGITRAKSNLFLTFPSTGSRFNFQRPSPFLEEIRSGLLEKKMDDAFGEFSEELPTIQLADDAEVSTPAGDWRKREFLRRLEEL